MNPEFSLEGRVAIVTGASRSIGKAIAIALGEAGADVVVSGRSERALESVAGQLEGLGARALVVVCDVQDPAAVRMLVTTCRREFGPPDVLVANAGVFQEWGPSENLSLEEWDRVTAVDLRGVWLTCQTVGREMTRRRSGSIVTIASIAGVVALRGAASYTASKFGVIGLTKALATEWARHGVRVNAVAPGFIERDEEPFKGDGTVEGMIFGRTPLARWGQPREVALPVVFLASPASRFITGAVLPVDGGWLAT